jgi:hypothetical protein
VASDTAYLEGGPCAGTTHTITAAESDTGEIVCKGALYRNIYSTKRHNGDLIFKFAGKASTGGTGTGALPAPRAHKGWSDMQRSVNHHWPRAMSRSEHQLRAAWRSLGRARKVHH